MRRRRWGCIVFFLAICLCVPERVQASGVLGSRASGASIPAYQEVVERKLEGDNISLELKEALAEAGERATDERQYKIVISPGGHTLDAADGDTEPYYIPSNVWIYARGAVVDTTCKKMFMTRPGAEEPFRNIKIEGGTYRQSEKAVEVKNRMLLRLSHVRNLEIRDASFLVNRRTHILEMGDASGVTISGCTFSGNDACGNDPPANYVQPKEAIQIDAATKTALPDHPPYNGKGSHDIIIRDNVFLNVARGIGSHNEGTEKQSYTDITIRDNTFRNLTAEAVHAMHWQGAAISGNTIVNGRHAGIMLADCRYCLVNVNEIRNLKPYVGLRKKRYKYFGGIIINGTTKNSTIKNNLLSGSAAKAVYLKGKKPRGNTISGNVKK